VGDFGEQLSERLNAFPLLQFVPQDAHFAGALANVFSSTDPRGSGGCRPLCASDGERTNALIKVLVLFDQVTPFGFGKPRERPAPVECATYPEPQETPFEGAWSIAGAYGPQAVHKCRETAGFAVTEGLIQQYPFTRMGN
jgi:hypothetical protein